MSQVLEVFVNGILLDLDPREVIEKNYQTFNLLNIGTSQGNFTSTFKVPATPKNKAALGFPGNSPVHNVIPRTLNDCSVNQRGLPIIANGFLVVESAQQNDISCTIYSGSINAIIDFTGEERIKDLIVPGNPFPIGYDYTWDQQTIYEGRNDQFPLIDWGSNFDELGGDPQTDIRGMAFTIPFRNLIQSIFWLHPNPRLAGRNLVGAPMEDNLFNALAIAFSGNEELIPDGSGSNAYFLADNTQDNLQNTGGDQSPKGIVFNNLVDPGGNFDLANGTYTVDPEIPIKGKFRLEVNASSYSGNQGEVRLFIQSSVKGLMVERTILLLSGKFTPLAVLETDEQTFEPGEIIQLGFQVDFGDPEAPSQSWLLKEGSLATVTLIEDPSGEGSNIIIKDNLPDIGQLDLIKEWVTMFGLILLPDANFDIDPDAPIQVFQFKDLARNFPIARQWSSKIDTREPISISHHFEQYSQANLVNWREDLQIETPVGNGVWTVTDQALGKESIRHESIFAPCIEIAQPGASNIIAQVRTFDEIFVKTETPKFRLVALTEGSGESVEWVTSAGQPLGATDYLIAHFLTGLPSGETLSWNNLIDQSYREFTQVLNQGFLLQVNLFLDELDLFSLDFLRPIFLEGQIKDVDLNGYYYLVQVTANREDQSSTPCLLAKIPEQPFTLFLDPDAQDYINRMLVHGIVFNEDQTEAINGYVNLAKDPVNGWWDTIHEDFLILGNNQAAHAEGLKSGGPDNTLVFINTIPSDHTWTGWRSNGIDSYAQLPVSFANIPGVGVDSGFFEVYLNTDLDAGAEDGTVGVNVGVNERMMMQTGLAPDASYVAMWASPNISFLSSSVQFSSIANRLGGNSQFWRRTLLIGEANQGGTVPNIVPFIGAFNNAGVPANFARRTYAGCAYGQGFTNGQIAAFESARNLLNGVFNREASFALDPDGVIFTNRAATDGFPFTNQERLIIDNYVKSLKAAGAWNNADHIWPFIGDNVIQHRINLKLPTIAWDLQFINTIPGDFTSQGWRPNGIDSYAITPAFPKLFNKSSLYVTENLNALGIPDFGCRAQNLNFDQDTATITIRSGPGNTIFVNNDNVSLLQTPNNFSPMIAGVRFSAIDGRIFHDGIQQAQTVVAQRDPAPQLNQSLGAIISGGFQQVLDVELSAGLKALSVLGQASTVEVIKYDIVNSDTLGFYNPVTGLWTTTRTIRARVDEAKIGIVIGSAFVTATISAVVAGETLDSQVITQTQFVTFGPGVSRGLAPGQNINIQISATQSQEVTQLSFYGSTKISAGEVSTYPYVNNNDREANAIRGWTHFSIPFPGNRPGQDPNRGHIRLLEGSYFDDPQAGVAASYSTWTVGPGGAGQYRIRAGGQISFLVSGLANQDWVTMNVTIGKFPNNTGAAAPTQVLAEQSTGPINNFNFMLDTGVITLAEGEHIRLTCSQVLTGSTPFGNLAVNINQGIPNPDPPGQAIISAGDNISSWPQVGIDTAWTVGPGTTRAWEVTLNPGQSSNVLHVPSAVFPGALADPLTLRTFGVDFVNDNSPGNEATTWIELWAKRHDAAIVFKVDEQRLDQIQTGGAFPTVSFNTINVDYAEWYGVRMRVEAGGVASTFALRSDLFTWTFSSVISTWLSIGRSNFDMKVFAARRNLEDTEFATLKISEEATLPEFFSSRRYGSLALLGDEATPEDVINESLITMQNQEALGRKFEP